MLLVIFAHSGLEIVSGGFIGVDVFFVISGYLITAQLLHAHAQTGQINFLRFYAKRLKRLLPALILMICVISLAAVWLLSGYEAGKQLNSGPYAATWTSNFYFVFVTLGYFDELARRDLFLHTWSLGVEEQFYLVWPAVMVSLNLFHKRLQTNSLNSSKFIYYGIGILCLMSFALSLYWTRILPQWAFYMMPARIWQFSLGALVFLLFHSHSQAARDSNTRLGRIFHVAGLVLIFVSAASMHTRLAYPGYWALIPSIGVALVIASGHQQYEGYRNLLAHPISVWVGDRSYSLYLWHWPIFVIGFALGLQGQTVLTLYLLLLIMMVAILSYRFIELPFWKGRFSKTNPRLILLTSLLIMTVVTTSIYFGLRILPQTEPGNPPRTDVPVIYKMKCDDWIFNARVEPCVFGSEHAPKTVMLIGDSHGAQWFSILPEIYKEPDWRIIVLTKSSCPLVDEDYFYPNINQIYKVCTDWRNGVLDALDKIKPDLLFIGSASTYGFSETQWVEGSSRIFERMSKVAGQVLVIPGTPNLGFDGPGCVSRNLTPDGNIDPLACQAKDRMQETELVRHYLEQAASRFTNIHLLNLNDLVCPDGNCNAMSKEGLVVFRDSQHLTDAFVRAQIPSINERLKQFSNN